MKHILLIALSLPIYLFGQLTYTPSKTVSKTGQTNKGINIKIYFDNVSGTEISTLSWKVIDSDIPASWPTYSLCDKKACYLAADLLDEQVKTISNIDADTTTLDSFKVTILPKTAGDSAHVTIAVFDGKNINDTLTFKVYDIVEGIGELTKDDFSVYPNPASDYTYININQPNTNLKIYSLLGEVIHAQELSMGKNEIDLSNLPVSYYYFSIENEQEKVVQRVIKR